MKRRVLLAVLVGVSLILAATIRYHQAVSENLKKTQDVINDLPKAERNRFQSNTIEFYLYNSKAERKRLRALYYRISSDPESQRFTHTLEEYVDWINRFSDPAKMRELQSLSVGERADEIRKLVQNERQSSLSEPVTLERLKETIRESLAPELRTVSPLPIFTAFDIWLTQQYDKVKTSLTPVQSAHVPKLEEFYCQLFRRTGMDSYSLETLSIPEKMAMIQLIQNLSFPLRGGGRGNDFNPFPYAGGPQRPSGPPFAGGGPPIGATGFRDDFFRTFDESFDQLYLNNLASLDNSTRQALAPGRPARTVAMQSLLALAILERYPEVLEQYPMSIDLWRFLQTTPPLEQEWIEILGAYLSMMTPTNREEFLKLDSTYTTNWLKRELWSNASSFYGLLRTNRDRFGTPPGPPRDSFPPDDGANRPRPGNGPNRDRRLDSGPEPPPGMP